MSLTRRKRSDEKMMKAFKKLKNTITRQKVVLVSNFLDDIDSEGQADGIVDDLRDNAIELVVIGPDILKVDDEDKSTKFDSQQCFTKSQQLVLKICDELGDLATLCTCDDALDLLQYFDSNVKKRRMAWNVDMSIGSHIKIPITGYKMLNDASNITWLQKSLTKKSNSCANQPTSTSSTNDESTNDEPKLQDVDSRQIFYLGEKEIDGEDIVKGYSFGSIVPFSAVDEEALRYDAGPRGLQVLFTVSRSQIPVHLLIGDSPYYIVGNNKNKDGENAMNAFIKGLHDTDMIAIARKVYTNNASNVLVGALFPKVDNNTYALIFVELPYKDEIRRLWFPTLKNVSVSDEQLSAVDKLIDDMDLTADIEDEIPYDPEKLKDPYEEYQLHCIAERALQGETKLDIMAHSFSKEIPKHIKALISPPPEIVKRCEDSIKTIQSLFSLEEVLTKSAKLRTQNDTTIVDECNVKIEPNLDITDNITDYFHSAVSVVGTIEPENDFKTLLARGEPFERVCEQLQKVIIELVRRADNAEMLMKPLLSLKTLRNSCIDKDFSNLYNDWIKVLKEISLEIQQKEFWNRVVEDQLGLILVHESNSSDITSEKGDEFYKFESSVKVQIEDCDIDDLLFGV